MRVPETYYDEIFEYNGQWDVLSKCGLRILSKAGQTLVIVTELYQDNPGTSVTGTGRKLLMQICEKKGLNPGNILYLECNPDTNSVLSFYDEEYFQVSFSEKNGSSLLPIYRQLSREEIHALFR